MGRLAALSDPFNDDARSIATLARLFRRLSGILVHLLAGSMAFGANILAGTGRIGFWIIVGCVVPRGVL
jgi:hypothetical protein